MSDSEDKICTYRLIGYSDNKGLADLSDSEDKICTYRLIGYSENKGLADLVMKIISVF